MAKKKKPKGPDDPIFGDDSLLESLKEGEVKEDPYVKWKKFFAQEGEKAEEDGWIYSKKTGKKLRKWYCNEGHGKSQFFYWSAKINNIAFCEEKRWKALRYRDRQIKPHLRVFDDVVRERPFNCLRLIKKEDEWPKTYWVEFPKYRDEDHGVSWNWLKDGEKPKHPLKQEVGDAWFAYEYRSRELQGRVAIFDTMFQLALRKKYAPVYYQDPYHQRPKIMAVINGREYLLGKNRDDEFGILAYPGDIIREVVR